MFPEKILFIDTETGGMDPQRHSLLSVGLVVWEKREITHSTEILLNDGILTATPEALAVNRINLHKHRLNALTPAEGLEEIVTFLNTHFPGEEKISPAGHNVHFDTGFIKVFFRQMKADYNEFFSHRIIDTSSILYYLWLAGRMSQKAVSSDAAFAYFGIEVEGRHTALGDTLATARLFNHLLELL